MPLFHCKDCHHEFENIPNWDYDVEEDWSIVLKSNELEFPKCDWCGGDTYVLEKKTPLEKMCEGDNIQKILEECVAISQQRKNVKS
jgi:hypothetical protein